MDYKELIALSQKAATEWRNDHTFYQDGTLIDSLCSDIETLLAEKDATNVAPVVHGRWVNRKVHGINYRICSVCGEYRPALNEFGKVAKRSYCPNCGAKMDMEQE